MKVILYDTTLRDGEQSPGASMTLEEKLRVAELLDEMGVDVIEAGFPIASDGDFEAVAESAKATKRAVVCGLARSGAKDIDRAAEALKPAKRRRIHTFISTSPLHMKFKLNMEPEAVYEAVIASVTRARNHTDDVEWSPEDGTRTEHDFLCRCVEAAIKAGATTINIPDTVGYAVPEEFGALIAMLHERVPNADQAVFSAHCHNDLGLAVANSLAGLGNGVRQIECTVKKEWMEREWKFKELTSSEKMYTGRSYPVREYEHAITLHDGRTISGGLSAVVYVQPHDYTPTEPGKYRTPAQAERFLLHKRHKGKIGEDLKSLRYVRRIKLGEDALREGREKATTERSR